MKMGVHMANRRIKMIGFLMVLICLVIGLFWGCNKERVNLRQMTPEEQFAYAKQMFDKKDYYKAKMQFTIIVLNNPGHQIIEKAQYYLAESYYFEKEYLLAVEEYQKLIRSLPQSPFVDDARFKVGMCYYELSPGYALDQEYTYKAISELQQFIEDYPDSEFRPDAEKWLNECIEKLAKKEYKTGELYRKMSIYSSALLSFDRVLKNYYDTKFADDALYWKGECHKKLKQWDEAETAFRDLIAKHPQSEWVKRAEEKLIEVDKERIEYSQEDSKRVEQ